MKKLITLIMAAGFILGSLGTAAAIDVKVNGQWQWSYGYYENYSMYKASRSDGGHFDNTFFRMRLRTQVAFIASETLSALINFEIGDLNYGGRGSWGKLDADDVAVKIKHAYMDWTIPGTQIKTRQGVQGLRLPWVVAGNPVMDADVAGVTVAADITPEVGLTFFWARPFDNNTGEYPNALGNTQNLYDEMDMFGIMVPIKTQAVRATPWAMVALIGRDSGYYNGYTGGVPTGNGDMNVQGAVNSTGGGRGRMFRNYDKVDSQTYGWWLGTTLELPILDPFFVKMDAMVGGLETGDSDSDTWGYYAALQAGYKFSWGTPSLLAWYASGDKAKDDRGTMPIVSDDNGFLMTRYGFSNQRWRNADCVVSGSGIGTWGLGAEIADLSFVQNLKHTARVVYFRGTNEGDGNNTPYTRSTFYPQSMGSSHAGYLMTSDSGWEFNLDNEYKVNENLTIALDFAYITMNMGAQNRDTNDSFAIMLGFQYAF